MSVAPEIRATERTARGVRLTLWISAELSYFEGHFPGCPVLPGVVQVTWAIELGRQHIPFAARFRSLNAVKFNRVILPDTTVTLQLDYDADKQQLDFAYALEGSPCSNGTVVFDDAPIPDLLDRTSEGHGRMDAQEWLPSLGGEGEPAEAVRIG